MDHEAAKREYRDALRSLNGSENHLHQALSELRKADSARTNHDIYHELVVHYGTGYSRTIKENYESALNGFHEAQDRFNEARRKLDFRRDD